MYRVTAPRPRFTAPKVRLRCREGLTPQLACQYYTEFIALNNFIRAGRFASKFIKTSAATFPMPKVVYDSAGSHVRKYRQQLNIGVLQVSWHNSTRLSAGTWPYRLISVLINLHGFGPSDGIQINLKYVWRQLNCMKETLSGATPPKTGISYNKPKILIGLRSPMEFSAGRGDQ